MKAIAAIAPQTELNTLYLGGYIFPPSSPVSRSDLECPVCCDVLLQPIQLPCNSVVCSVCCKQWVSLSFTDTVSCPCCHQNHPFTPDDIRAPSLALLNVLSNLIVTCVKCSNMVRAGDHTSHLSSKCKECIHTLPASPSTGPTEATGSIIKRLLSESQDGATISIATSGKVLIIKSCSQ